MRLLFVHERFGALGGAESNARITAAELRARGHTVGLLHGPSTGRDEQSWCDAFAQRYSLPPSHAHSATLRAVASFHPDVIYVHKMPDLGVIEALVKTSRPLVRMVHDHDIYCMKSYKYAYFSRRVCRRPLSLFCVFPCGAFLARNRDGQFPVKYVSYTAKKREIKLNQKFQRIIVVSQYMKEELLRNGFESELIRILPPVPRMGDCQVRSSYSDRNLVLFAGQIIRGKGVDVLLRAVAQVRCSFDCVILGDGSHRAACERLRDKLGLRERVTFRGFVPQEELKEYYRECSVLALSSVWPEPIATIGLEAMRYALPVVAFDAGGIRDWLIDGYNGYLVRWMDHAQFAQRLESLLRDKALAKAMGERGLRLANERFDFSRYISGLESLFGELDRERPHVAA